jgi:NhaA family Na+:H+ antiporter
VLGLAIPARPRRHPRGGPEVEAPLTRFVEKLHPLVAFAIMPAFALANSGVDLRGLTPAQWTGPVAVGIAVALFAGKLVGIFAVTTAAVRSGIAPMPGGASLRKLLGVSIVAGIGFTVALFIAGLAYPDDPALLDQAKLGILAGSLAAGIVGGLVLRLSPPEPASAPDRRADALSPTRTRADAPLRHQAMAGTEPTARAPPGS